MIERSSQEGSVYIFYLPPGGRVILWIMSRCFTT